MTARNRYFLVLRGSGGKLTKGVVAAGPWETRLVIARDSATGSKRWPWTRLLCDIQFLEYVCLGPWLSRAQFISVQSLTPANFNCGYFAHDIVHAFLKFILTHSRSCLDFFY